MLKTGQVLTHHDQLFLAKIEVNKEIFPVFQQGFDLCPQLLQHLVLVLQEISTLKSELLVKGDLSEVDEALIEEQAVGHTRKVLG